MRPFIPLDRRFTVYKMGPAGRADLYTGDQESAFAFFTDEKKSVREDEGLFIWAHDTICGHGWMGYDRRSYYDRNKHWPHRVIAPGERPTCGFSQETLDMVAAKVERGKARAAA